MTENKDAAVRPPVAEIREVFVECATAMAKFGETKKQADHRAWKRKGSVLEVVCVGHMRKCLDYIEYLETIATPPAQDAMREALEEISDAHLGDQPATSGGSEYDWAVRHISRLRGIARAALSTPQPESVEAAVERVTYAIILGSSGERAADHAKEFQTANWEDARRSAIAVIKAMPAATCNDGLQVALAEAIEALMPFARSYKWSKEADERNTDHAARPHDYVISDHFKDAAQVVAKHGGGR